MKTIPSCIIALFCGVGIAAGEVQILNVSYDVTREFYKEFNPLFEKAWEAKSGQTVKVNQSHGGSSKQARAVLDGIEADVVTMNQTTDIDILAERGGLLPKGWANRLPNGSAPFSSTIVYLVRAGNPKGIKDWPDLIRPGVQVIMPNPKTSGNGRYSYLAAWSYALKANGQSEAAAREFVQKLLRNVPVFDAGGRGATTSFAQNGIGDVLLTFENEVHLIEKEFGEDRFDPVYPTMSILAEAPVAVVDKIVEKRGTRAVAEAYLQHLYSDEGQELGAAFYFRPSNPAILEKFRDRFPNIELVRVSDVFGGLSAAQKKHFDDGSIFDQIAPR
jgi:sulfate transport system substrate-binding protein